MDSDKKSVVTYKRALYGRPVPKEIFMQKEGILMHCESLLTLAFDDGMEAPGIGHSSPIGFQR